MGRVQSPAVRPAVIAAWVVKRELQRGNYNPELASTLVFAAALGGLNALASMRFSLQR